MDSSISTQSYIDISFDGEEFEEYSRNGYIFQINVEELILFNDIYTDSVYSDFKHVNLRITFVHKEPISLKVGDRCIFYIDNYRDSMNGFGPQGPSASCTTGSFYGSLDYDSLPTFFIDNKFRTVDITDTIYGTTEYSYTDSNGIIHTYEIETEKGHTATTNGAYMPIISKIDGTLEEFLADPENEDWKNLFTQLEIMNGCLPVVGTDCLEGQYAFVTDKAKIIDGRFFTDAEYENGEKVLIISKEVAEDSNLKVGDKIKLSQFHLTEEAGRTKSYYEERALYYDREANININPAVGSFTSIPKFTTVDEEFTIVGIYDHSEDWTTNMFAFTPNTVFMPKSAQIGGGYGGISIKETIEYTHEITGEPVTSTTVYRNGAEGVGLVVEIKNGMMDEFKQEIAETDMDGKFLVFDQGYEESIIPARLLASMGRNLFIIVVSGWILLLILYVLLYQTKQNKTLGIMRSIGATSGKTRRYIFICGIIPAILGVTIGTALSMSFIKYSQSWILGFIVEQGDIANESGRFSQMLSQNQIEPTTFVYTAIIQIIIFAVVLWLCGYVVAKRPPRKLTSK